MLHNDSPLAHPKATPWAIIKLVAGLIVWLGLMVLSFVSLLTVPALVLVGCWLAIAAWRYFRRARRPSARIRPDEEFPSEAHHTQGPLDD